MSYSMTIKRGCAVSGSDVTKSDTVTGELLTQVDVSVNNSTTLNVVCSLDVSQIKGIYMFSDRALTVKTNSSGSPDDTIALVAGVPYIWTTSDNNSILLGTDVTSLYLVNASGGTASFQLKSVVDATP